MATNTFELNDLRRILQAAAGADEAADLDSDITDSSFDSLGYESLALLETCGRIEREYGITLDDVDIESLTTPGKLIDEVNVRLSKGAA